MIYITKIKSVTNVNRTLHSVVSFLFHTINNQIDSIIEYENFDENFLKLVHETNCDVKSVLDGNTICQHHLVLLVNRLWTIVNRLGIEIRAVQGSNPDVVVYNIIFTKIQNYYFNVFLEFNHLIRLEIKDLKRSEYTESEIEKLTTAAFLSAVCPEEIKTIHSINMKHIEDSPIHEDRKSVNCSICSKKDATAGQPSPSQSPSVSPSIRFRKNFQSSSSASPSPSSLPSIHLRKKIVPTAAEGATMETTTFPIQKEKCVFDSPVFLQKMPPVPSRDVILAAAIPTPSAMQYANSQTDCCAIM